MKNRIISRKLSAGIATGEILKLKSNAVTQRLTFIDGMHSSGNFTIIEEVVVVVAEDVSGELPVVSSV